MNGASPFILYSKHMYTIQRLAKSCFCRIYRQLNSVCRSANLFVYLKRKGNSVAQCKETTVVSTKGGNKGKVCNQVLIHAQTLSIAASIHGRPKTFSCDSDQRVHGKPYGNTSTCGLRESSY